MLNFVLRAIPTLRPYDPRYDAVIGQKFSLNSSSDSHLPEGLVELEELRSSSSWMCFYILLCVSVSSHVLLYIALGCYILPCVAIFCHVFLYFVMCCYRLPCVATYILPCVARYCHEFYILLCDCVAIQPCVAIFCLVLLDIVMYNVLQDIAMCCH